MTTIELTFLGTSCMVPTKDRNAQGIFLKYKGEGILLDCGEGTQRQMNIAGISRMDVTRIFITHWHGDHVGGLMPLLQTMNREVEHRVEIHGPKGTKERMEHGMKSIDFPCQLDLQIFEHDCDRKKGIKKILETEDFVVEVASLRHTTPAIGYAFIEKDRRRINMPLLKRMGIPEGPHLQKLQKGEDMVYQGKKVEVEKATTLVQGKKITLLQDTAVCGNLALLAKDSDVLICEATYCETESEKAEKHHHMTAKQAAQIAHEAGAKKLYLTNFSQRYDTITPIREEARTYFKGAECAHDFLRVKV